jgi:hypothetical protein
MMTGCATTSLKFTQSEVKLIPVVSLPRVLLPGSMDETVKVKAGSLQGPATVKSLDGQGYVILNDDHNGKEVKLPLSEIVEIERIRRTKKSKDGYHGSTGEAVGEALIYAPLIPVAVVSWPFLRVMGLDAVKNSEDDKKALLVYGGMSKEDLRTYIGEPKEKYYCEAKGKSGAYEIWVYRKDQVLRGGRSLFIGLGKEKVYFTSYLLPSQDGCSLTTE